MIALLMSTRVILSKNDENRSAYILQSTALTSKIAGKGKKGILLKRWSHWGNRGTDFGCFVFDSASVMCVD